ncbi:MAG: class II aldolase/adducin family protein [Anaerolineae bacterium]|nr:class II aldolase/adducin family protein [Anaerolineae bacterium]
MALDQPYPDLDEFLTALGEAGQRLSSINASEGAAGNISIYIGWPLEVRRRFPVTEPFNLPVPAPALAGGLIIVTGSGRRLRDIRTNPAANLAVVAVAADGQGAQVYLSPHRLFQRVTSEFNSHLAVHSDQVARTGTNFHALIHAQPPHLTYLSHIPAYRDEAYLNQRLLRWEPETIVNLPEGIGVLAYRLPGSPAMMEANVAGLREHRVVLWSKHGVMARSELSVTKAADRVEYAETAALYEYMDLVSGGRGEGLTLDELRAIVQAFNVPTTLV